MSRSTNTSSIQSRHPTFHNKKCSCGLRAALKISESEKNPGRLYYKCPKDKTKGEKECSYWEWCYQDGWHQPTVDAPQVKLVQNDAHVEVIEVNVANLKHMVNVGLFISGLALVIATIALLKCTL